MKTVSLWIFGLLFICLHGAQGLSQFPDNIVVAKIHKAITLTCAPNTEGNVTWKLDGDEIDVNEDHLQQNGSDLAVTEVDYPFLGEYSCWRGEEKLSSVYLMEAKEEEDLDSLLSCRARSYDCVFSCSWTSSEYDLVRLGLGQNCTEGGKSCQWVSSGDQHSDGTFQFEVSHSLSPFAEENTELELTVEAITDLYIARKTKRFYLRDIVEPDSPQIVRCQVVEQDLNVTIDPPSSWSTPHSFFSLEHEIEYVLKDNGKTGRSLSTVIPKRISKLRVRSRDSLVLSAWSQWTPWKNVITSKQKLCKCVKTAKVCCPELSPESFESCKKREKKKKKKDVKQR